MNPNLACPCEGDPGRGVPYFAGVEVGPDLILAGIFNAELRLLGKTKHSTKRERGTQTVIERIGRCLHYAADECDLSLEQVAGIGVAVPGWVDLATGVVQSAPALGWTDAVPLQTELERLISTAPIRVANVHNLGALAIRALELDSEPRDLAAIFVAPEITLALLHDGAWLDLQNLEAVSGLLEAPARQVFRTLPSLRSSPFRSRDLRRAIQKGDLAALQQWAEMVDATAELASLLEERFRPEQIVLGGAIVEEMNADLILQVQRRLRPTAGGRTRTPLLASALGKIAGIAGAAAWAA